MADNSIELRRILSEYSRQLEKTADLEERRKLLERIKIVEDQLRRYERGESKLSRK